MALVNKKDCCDCGALVTPCSCNGVGCGIQCQSKAATAALCGFEEFTDPSLPPRKYRKKTIAGTMQIAKYAEATCDGSAAVTPALACRSKAGTATLCGFSEYTTPSTPPKKYRTQTLSGELDTCFSDGMPGCPGPNGFHGQVKNVFTGTYTYDAMTCAETNAQNNALWNSTADGSATCSNALFRSNSTPSASFPTPSCHADSGGSADVTKLETPTEVTWTGNNLCVNAGCGLGKTTGTLTKTLSDEDTEESAVDRATSGGSWNTAGTCNDHTSYRIRNPANFNVSYRRAQTQVTIPFGLEIGADYEIRITLFRRAAGSSDPFVDSGEVISEFFTADDVEYTTDWLDITESNEWEYRAESVDVIGILIETITDHWDLLREYASDDLECDAFTTDTDESERLLDGTPTEPPPGHFNIDGPNYGSGAEGGDLGEGELSQATRKTVGTEECVDGGDGFGYKHSGEVIESLSVEDDEEDAMLRSDPADWSAQECTAAIAFKSVRGAGQFSFGYRKVQVRANLTNLTVGQFYEVTIRVFRRILSSGGPFLFFGTLQFTHEATAATESTQWQDLPNEAGWETKAVDCSAELV